MVTMQQLEEWKQNARYGRGVRSVKELVAKGRGLRRSPLILGFGGSGALPQVFEHLLFSGPALGVEAE